MGFFSQPNNVCQPACLGFQTSASKVCSSFGLGSGLLDSLHGVSLGTVQLHKLGEIKLGLLEHLGLADKHVLKREDLGALLGDFLSNCVLDTITQTNKR